MIVWTPGRSANGPGTDVGVMSVTREGDKVVLRIEGAKPHGGEIGSLAMPPETGWILAEELEEAATQATASQHADAGQGWQTPEHHPDPKFATALAGIAQIGRSLGLKALVYSWRKNGFITSSAGSLDNERTRALDQHQSTVNEMVETLPAAIQRAVVWNCESFELQIGLDDADTAQIAHGAMFNNTRAMLDAHDEKRARNEGSSEGTSSESRFETKLRSLIANEQRAMDATREAVFADVGHRLAPYGVTLAETGAPMVRATARNALNGIVNRCAVGRETTMRSSQGTTGPGGSTPQSAKQSGAPPWRSPRGCERSGHGARDRSCAMHAERGPNRRSVRQWHSPPRVRPRARPPECLRAHREKSDAGSPSEGSSSRVRRARKPRASARASGAPATRATSQIPPPRGHRRRMRGSYGCTARAHQRNGSQARSVAARARSTAGYTALRSAKARRGPHKRARRWRNHDDRTIVSGIAANRTHAEIAATLRRTTEAVRGRAHKIGAVRTPHEARPERSGLPWSHDDDRMLKALRARRVRIVEIGAQLKRTPRAISNRVETLGLQRRWRRKGGASEPVRNEAVSKIAAARGARQ